MSAQLLVTSLSSGLGAQAALSQSTQAVSSYVSWIESQDSSQAGDQAAAVNQIKSRAAGWYNLIYPQYLNMPALVAAKSTEITNDLNLLIAMAEQYQSAGSALNSQIQQSASDLTKTVSALAQQANSLGQSIQTFRQNIIGDRSVIDAALRQIGLENANANNQMADQYGQLHHLQTAACISNTDINECKKLIAQTEQAISQLQQAFHLLGDIGLHMGNIANSASYLGSYWTTVGGDAGNCLQSLGQLSTNPATIGQVDLSGAAQRWNNLVQQYQLTAQQLSAA